jgi:hypothetical protein
VKLELQKYTKPFNTTTTTTTTEPLLTFDLQSALQNSNTNRTTTVSSCYTGNIIPNHYQYYSLQELFPTLFNLSIWFNINISFRNDLRSAIRNDIFYSTGTYQNMSQQTQTILLLPDSSIQGDWKCTIGRTNSTSSNSSSNIRMIQLTAMLQKYFGTDCINGDVFMETIGALCNSDNNDDDDDDDDTDMTTTSNQPNNHWIDIVGIKNRRVTHSWHQDTGRSHMIKKDTNNHYKKKTVLWGFPCEDEYDGIGVFSHIIPLQQEQIATDTHPMNVPIVYDDVLFSNHNNMEDYIVRPTYRRGQEILVYSDTDVLHSAPDITYRTSCMRFM